MSKLAKLYVKQSTHKFSEEELIILVWPFPKQNTKEERFRASKQEGKYLKILQAWSEYE